MKKRSSPSRRVRLWDKKLEEKSYALILPKVKPIAKEIFSEYQASHHNLITKVKNVLARRGIDATSIYAYVWYAQGLWYEKVHKKDRALQIHADATYMYYRLLGLDDETLREIAHTLGINISPIEEILGDLVMSEEVVYKGTKKALKETLERVETDLTDVEVVYDESTGNIKEIIKYDKITGSKKKITLEYDAEGRLIRKTEEWL